MRLLPRTAAAVLFEGGAATAARVRHAAAVAVLSAGAVAASASHASAGVTAAASATGAINVTVSGIRSRKGLIHVDVCPQASFLHACPYSAAVPAQAGTVTVTIGNVPPGTYAVQAFQDANANGQVDQGMFGIPREGIGFSNDAMAKLVRPKWAVAAFDHGSSAQTIPVTLRYFLG